MADLSDQRIEMKFLLDAQQAARVRAWALENLGIDANCNSKGTDSYALNTLYFDSPHFDLFYRTGVVGIAKHRIRRYADEPVLWLETKRKKKMVVTKNRTAVAESKLAVQLAMAFKSSLPHRPTCEFESCGPPMESTCDSLLPKPWCGDWFLQRIAVRALQPAVQIGYQRFARTATIAGESLRLTIDSHMTARPACGWFVAHACKLHSTPPSTHQSAVAFGDREVLELKFHNHLPQLFKQLLQTFALPASGYSKYRHAVQALGLVPELDDSARECMLDA